MKKDLPFGSLLEKSQAASRTQAENLQRVNEGLRELCLTLRKENDRLGALSGTRAPPVSAAPPASPPTHDVLRSREQQLARMQQTLEALQAENRQLSERFQTVELQGFQLLNAAVATARLHGLLQREQVREGIQDLVVNLVGSEEVAILELSPDGTALELTRSLGVDPTPLSRLPLEAGRIGRALAEDRTWLAGDDAEEAAVPAHERTLSACVPLRLGPVRVGAVAIFRLLPHKERLDSLDRELLEQLRTHAATTLYCARLHERLQPQAP